MFAYSVGNRAAAAGQVHQWNSHKTVDLTSLSGSFCHLVHIAPPPSRLANDANIVLPRGECCATRAGFHCECPNCGARFCSEACLEEAYRAWHKTLCPRAREPDPAHPLSNLVSGVTRQLYILRDKMNCF